MDCGCRIKAQDDRRIWMFTNNDDPNQGNATERRSALRRAKDSAEVHEELRLYALPGEDGAFDVGALFGAWRVFFLALLALSLTAARRLPSQVLEATCDCR